MRALIVALLLLFVAPRGADAIRPVVPSPGDYARDAQLFYRVVACGGDAPVAAAIQAIVDAHCAWMKKSVAMFRKRYADPASAFFAKVRPAGLPTTVVYPFGGGDLVSALITYPEATEITTLSLEHAGDPTRLAQLTPRQLKKYLARFRDVVRGLLANSDSESVKLKLLERGPIPGQLAFHITGAAILGYEPVALRYFDLAADGSIDYHDDREIAERSSQKARKKKGSWVDTDWSVAFTHMELTLRKVGDPSRTVVHRHLAANLENSAFAGSATEQHLQAKGKVAAMTKAASYLLWRNNFSAIRTYLATNLVWMASDSTGIPPAQAKKAGLAQETYGRFGGAMLEAPAAPEAATVKLWASQPHRKLTFRYGYRDAQDRPHLMITRPAS